LSDEARSRAGAAAEDLIVELGGEVVDAPTTSNRLCG